MRLYLTQKEKTKLSKEGVITIERNPYLSNTSKKNIIHGIGTQSVFDKIDYKWVYGDCDDYIDKMKNIGRRAVDYPDNKGNIWNGSKWWDCLGDSNEFGLKGNVITNGRLNKNSFVIEDIFISELKQNKKLDEYNQIVFSITIKKINLKE
jgi:hypothetical protein